MVHRPQFLREIAESSSASQLRKKTHLRFFKVRRKTIRERQKSLGGGPGEVIAVLAEVGRKLSGTLH